LSNKKILVYGITLFLLIIFWLMLNKENSAAIEQASSMSISKSATTVSAIEDMNQKAVKEDIEITLTDKQQDYILECDPKVKEIDSTEFIEHSLEDFHKKLKNSGSSFDQFAYNLLQDFNISKNNNLLQAQNNFDSLLEYSKNSDTQNLALFTLLQACAYNFKLQGCAQVETQAKSKLGDNAAIWQAIAIKYIKQGEQQLALQAIQDATQATYYADYNFEFEDIYRESLLANGFAHDYNQAIFLAKGYSMARSMVGFSELVKLCKNNIKSIKKSCLKMGSVMKDSSTSILTSIVGANLLKEIYKVNNNKPEIEKLDVYIKEIYPGARSVQLSNLMTYDESLTINFIENWRVHGEIIANKLLIKEAIDKSKDENYNPCI